MTPAATSPVKTPRPHDVALLCNPQAGGRWRVLADVLDSDEAKSAHRIVTDHIHDIREAIAGLGQRVKLLCIYGGDGTICRVINELLRNPAAPPPRLALLGGGTMNVAARWCGMTRSPGDNFRQVMRAYMADRLLWREVPLLAVRQQEQPIYGFTFGVGPIVRILAHYEAGRKSNGLLLRLAARSFVGALGVASRSFRPVLREMEAVVRADGELLAHRRWTALFANVTGSLNPFVEPFVGERTRNSFHMLAYAVSPRELAIMAPLLARALLPMDPRSVLHPLSVWRHALLSLVGKGGLPTDPRYINRAARKLVVETSETHFTVDGELFPSAGRRLDVCLGPALHLAALSAQRHTIRRAPPPSPATTTDSLEVPASTPSRASREQAP